jgi:hypothetical protein
MNSGTAGWFVNGPRSTDEQMLGLDYIVQTIQGRTVLDLGAAEACISAKLIESGAVLCDAVDCNADTIESAHRLHRDHVRSGKLRLYTANLNEFCKLALKDSYDTVLLLSILHKLRDPIGFLAEVLPKAADILAVRLPNAHKNTTKHWGTEFDVQPTINAEFRLIQQPQTCRDEWLGIYRRN